MIINHSHFSKVGAKQTIEILVFARPARLRLYVEGSGNQTRAELVLLYLIRGSSRDTLLAANKREGGRRCTHAFLSSAVEYRHLRDVCYSNLIGKSSQKLSQRQENRLTGPDLFAFGLSENETICHALGRLVSTQQKRDGYFNLAKVISVAAVSPILSFCFSYTLETECMHANVQGASRVMCVMKRT